MAGDLEDFLRRAAQRRQAKAVEQQRAQEPPRPMRPQYSNSRTERVVRHVEEAEEILTAEIVPEYDAVDDSHSRRIQQMEDQRRKIEESKKVARRVEAETAAKMKKHAQRTASESSAPQSTGNLIADLIANMRRPGGIQQAILLREILDRPEDRW